MKTIENIKTGKKYQVTMEEYNRIMGNPVMKSKYITHKSAEVPEEVKKEIAKQEKSKVEEGKKVDLPK